MPTLLPAILTLCAAFGPADPAPAPADASLPKPINDLCPIGAEPVVMIPENQFTYHGLPMAVCCPPCIPDFLNKWTQEQRDEFTLKYLKPVGGVCPLDGQPVEDGAPAIFYHGFEIGFCCELCAANFANKPESAKDAFLARHVAPVNAAAVCPVSGRAPSPDAPAVSWNAVVIRFCCEKCAAKWATMDATARDALAAQAAAAAKPAPAAPSHPG